MANRAFMNFGHMYANHASPTKIDCNFIVDATNGNGLGIRSLKSNGYVKNVYMHTSATPLAGNPNPANGIIMIQLADNYRRIDHGTNSIVSPLSGSSLVVNSTALTPGAAYVIVSVGSTTPAQWLALGIPAGVTPAVGLAFVAKVSGVSGGGSGAVQAPSTSGILSIETVGDSNAALGPQGVSNQGGWIILQCLDAAGAVAAPAASSVISIMLSLDNSSVTVDGD